MCDMTTKAATVLVHDSATYSLTRYSQKSYHISYLCSFACIESDVCHTHMQGCARLHVRALAEIHAPH
jgi:hypothetical protein